MIKNSVGGAVERYDILNRFPMMLERMGYGAEDAAAATEKLKNGVLGLPTALQDIVARAQGLLVLTGNLETATDTALALNNAFLASGSSAADASRGMIQYQQMLSKGTVDMQSWRTLQETMGYALRQTAEAFGFAGSAAVNDLYSALQKGNITFEQFNAQIISLSNKTGGFAEMAKTSSIGIGTAWTNMQTAVVRGTTGIITSIDQNLTKNSLPNLQGMIEITGKSFEGLLNTGAKLAGGFVSAVAPAIKFTADNMNVLAPAVTGAALAFGAHKTINAFKIALDAARKAVAAHTAATSLLDMTTRGALATEHLAAAAKGKLAGAAALRTAIMKAGIVVDKEGNVTTAAGIVLTEAEAASLIKSSGAMTVKTAVMALLTKGTEAAAAKQWLLNAAQAAAPWAIAIAGAAALAAGIGILVNSFNRANDDTKRLNARMSNLRGEMEKTSQMDAQIKKYKQIDAELKNTSLSSEKVAEKQDELNTVRRWIVDNSNGIITAEDDITGAFSRQLEILKDVTDQTIAQDEAVLKSLSTDAQENFASTLGRVNAATEEGNRLSAEQGNLADNQYDIFTKLNKIREESRISEENSASAIIKRNSALDEASKSSGEQFKSIGDLQKAVDRYDASIASAADGDENLARWQSERTYLAGLLTTATEAEASATDILSAGKAKQNELIKDAIALTDGQYDGLFRNAGVMDDYGNIIGDVSLAIPVLQQIQDKYGTSVGNLTEKITQNGEASEESKKALIDTVAILAQAAEAGYITADAFKEYRDMAIGAGIATEELADIDSETTSTITSNSRIRAQTMSKEEKQRLGQERVFEKIAKDRAKAEEAETNRLRAEAAKRKMTVEEYVAFEGRLEKLRIEQIKAGNVEITASYAQMLETRRQNGEELNAIEQAELNQWKDTQSKRQEEMDKHTELVGLAFDKISTKSRGMAKKVKKTFDDNAKAYAEWSENLKTLQESGLFSPEALAEIAAGGADKMSGFVADLLTMPEAKQKEVVASYEKAVTAAKEATETEAGLMSVVRDEAQEALTLDEDGSQAIQDSYTAAITDTKTAMDTAITESDFPATTTALMESLKPDEAGISDLNSSFAGLISGGAGGGIGIKEAMEERVAASNFATVAGSIIKAMADHILASLALPNAVGINIIAAKTAASTVVGSGEKNIFRPIGVSIIQGLIDGLASKEGDLYKKMEAVANGMKDKLKKAWEIASPSKVAFRLAGFVGQGWIDGIVSMAGKMEAAMDRSFSYAPELQAASMDASATYQPRYMPTMSAGGPSSHEGVTINQYIQSVPQTQAEFASAAQAMLMQARWQLS